MANPMPSDHVRFLDNLTKRADIQGRRKHVLLDRAERLIDKAIQLVHDERDWNRDNPEHDKLTFAADINRKLKHALKPKGQI